MICLKYKLSTIYIFIYQIICIIIYFFIALRSYRSASQIIVSVRQTFQFARRNRFLIFFSLGDFVEVVNIAVLFAGDKIALLYHQVHILVIGGFLYPGLPFRRLLGQSKSKAMPVSGDVEIEMLRIRLKLLIGSMRSMFLDKEKVSFLLILIGHIPMNMNHFLVRHGVRHSSPSC